MARNIAETTWTRAERTRNLAKEERSSQKHTLAIEYMHHCFSEDSMIGFPSVIFFAINRIRQ